MVPSNVEKKNACEKGAKGISAAAWGVEQRVQGLPHQWLAGALARVADAHVFKLALRSRLRAHCQNGGIINSGFEKGDLHLRGAMGLPQPNSPPCSQLHAHTRTHMNLPPPRMHTFTRRVGLHCACLQVCVRETARVLQQGHFPRGEWVGRGCIVYHCLCWNVHLDTVHVHVRVGVGGGSSCSLFCGPGCLNPSV